MSYADKLRIPYVILLGEDELAAGLCSVKDLETGRQITVSAQEAIDVIRQGLQQKNSGQRHFGAGPIRYCL